MTSNSSRSGKQFDQQTSDKQLSEKQLKILKFIETEISQTGFPPTLRDIAKHCGYDSIGTVQDHIYNLKKKGFIEKTPGRARGLKLTNRPESTSVPILGTVPAGRPIEAIENHQGFLSISGLWKGDLFALKVRGDSMKDAGILENDYVIVKKQQIAENGQIIVALIDGEATVKYLEKKPQSTRLIPANPNYFPIELRENSENSIQGVVVSLYRTY